MAGLPDAEAAFPNLLPHTYQKTSDRDPRYNCIAWAAGNNSQWWEPVGMPPYYWPPGIALERTLASYIQVFELFGYERCDDGKYARGYEKIAIYVDRHGVPSHAARQQGPNNWTSKLGKQEDIEHLTLDALTGNIYGTVAQFLRRRSRRSHTIWRVVEASIDLAQRLKRRFCK